MSKQQTVQVSTFYKLVQVGDPTESDPKKNDISAEEQTDFNVIRINEEADLKFNIKVQSVKGKLLPTYGPSNDFLQYFFLLHKSVIAIYLPYQVAFQNYPTIETVLLDTYLDFVFFIDIIMTFFRPIKDNNSRLITNRQQIAIKYLSSFFFMDLFCCFPFSYIKMKSEFYPRSKDDL